MDNNLYMAGLATKNPPTKKKPLESPKIESYLSLIFLFLSLFTAFSLFSYDDGEYGAQNNLFGRLGHLSSWILFYFLGRSAFQIPFFLFGFGLLFFQKKQTNLKQLLYGLGIILLAGAVYANLFEREIFSLKHGGGKFGTWTSELLEYFVGKSGRVLVALAAYIFGLILIIKEFPKEINKQLWSKIYFKIKERILLLAIPKPNIASEIQDETKEVPLKNYDLPWIEIKKVPSDWKFATSKTFSTDTNYRTSTVTEIEEEDTENVSNNILERTKNFFETVKSSRPITKLFKKTEKVETATQESVSSPLETLKEQPEDLSIQLPETSKTLKEKIYGAPLPSTEMMEALNISEEVSETEPKTPINQDIEDQVTAEELEMIFASDSTDVYENIEVQQDQQIGNSVSESQFTNYETLVKLAEQEEGKNAEDWQEKSYKTEEEKSDKLPLFRTTVPKINFLRKTQYKISHKNLVTNLEKKPNPMFRLEAEYTARKIEEIIKEYSELGKELKTFLSDVSLEVFESLEKNEEIIFEGAQGTFLDNDFGTYPFVTSSHPLSSGAPTGVGIPFSKITKIIGVVKAYTTRVGFGPFLTELVDKTGEHLISKGNEFGTTTGRKRRVGWLDLPMLRTSMRLNGFTELAITKLDVLSGLKTIKVCTSYKINEKKVNYFPYSNKGIEKAEPIYKDFEGFNIIGTEKKFEELDKNARIYLEYIEKELKTPIKFISIGAERGQTILK
ncbi:MAG: adenylosuccinate synthetase [Candidatus Diapherotrites archaeon]